jgi:lipopolysaccharide transport system permease protein
MLQIDDLPVPPLHSSQSQPGSAPAGPLNGEPTGQRAPADSFELVIRPRSGWIGINWKELIAYRELLLFLIWRDISVRYKQTVLGSAWAILQPLLLMLMFTFIFGRVAKIPVPNDLPYPVFVFAGLIPWVLFSQGFAQSALSLVNQQHLLTKVYFPRLFVPTAAAAVFLVDLTFSLGIYALILVYYRVVPSWTIILLPFLVVLTLIATLSVGLTLSALTVFYRDFRHIVPFLQQIFLFFTPVIYPTSLITRPLYRWILSVNPMFGIVTAYRSAILGIDWDLPCLAISTAAALGSFAFGMFYFRRTERRFADFA